MGRQSISTSTSFVTAALLTVSPSRVLIRSVISIVKLFTFGLLPLRLLDLSLRLLSSRLISSLRLISQFQLLSGLLLTILLIWLLLVVSNAIHIPTNIF